jgi:amino acid transporter
MTTTAKYFRDRVVMLLFSTMIFLALALSMFILLRLSSNHGNGNIVQYRSNLGLDAFKTGTIAGLLSFIGFAVLTPVIHTVLSLRTYSIHRQLSIVILALGVLLLVLAIIVSNALLVLR